MVSYLPKTISSRTYIALYAALETLLFEFRQSHNLELAVTDTKAWNSLRKKLESAIRSVLSEDSSLSATRRDYVVQKIPELTRISFGAALTEFCATYSVDLTDLWPISGKLGLSDIRNMYVHGHRFGNNQWPMLMSAHENLRWTIERMMLGVLGCPVKKTRADKAFLASHANLYQTWKRDQESLTKLHK